MTQPNNASIDHRELVENHWADRYLLGQLAVDELQWYENHFPTCETCLEELEVAEALREAVRKADVLPNGNSGESKTNRASTPDWKWLGLGLAAGLILGLLAPLLTTKDPSPVLDISTFTLIAERNSTATLEAVKFKPRETMVALNIPVPSSPHGYLLVMRKQGTKVVYRAEMNAASGNQKWVLLQKRHFPPGVYTLDVEVLDDNRETTLYSQHQFEVSYANGS